MKPFFCTDITNDKNNDKVNGEIFETITAPEDLLGSLEKNREGIMETSKRADMPLWLYFIKLFCGTIGAIIVINSFLAGLDDGFMTVYNRAPWLIISGFVMLVAFALIHFWGNKKKEKVVKEENLEENVKRFENLSEAVYNAMGVPSSADEVDIITFIYKVKDGKIMPKAPGILPTPYLNFVFRAYTDGDSLLIACEDSVFKFEKSELKRISTVKKNTALIHWTKDEPIKHEKFKPYKLATNQFGNVFVKQYHILEVERGGETYGIYFPSYELPVFERLTGLTAER